MAPCAPGRREGGGARSCVWAGAPSWWSSTCRHGFAISRSECESASWSCGPLAIFDRSTLRTGAARWRRHSPSSRSAAASTCGARDRHARQRGPSPAGRSRATHATLRQTHAPRRSMASRTSCCAMHHAPHSSGSGKRAEGRSPAGAAAGGAAGAKSARRATLASAAGSRLAALLGGSLVGVSTSSSLSCADVAAACGGPDGCRTSVPTSSPQLPSCARTGARARAPTSALARCIDVAADGAKCAMRHARRAEIKRARVT